MLQAWCALLHPSAELLCSLKDKLYSRILQEDEDLPISAHARSPPSTDLDSTGPERSKHEAPGSGSGPEHSQQERDQEAEQHKQRSSLSADLRADATARHASPPHETPSVSFVRSARGRVSCCACIVAAACSHSRALSSELACSCRRCAAVLAECPDASATLAQHATSSHH